MNEPKLTPPQTGIWKKYLNDARPFLALALLLAVCMLSNESFRSVQNLLNITRQVACTGIAALGMTLVIIAGGIDLSVGSLLALSGVSALMVMGRIADPRLAVAAAMLVSLGAGIAGGVLNGLLVTAGKVPPFIATLGTLSIFRSLALYLANAGTLSSSNEFFRETGSCTPLGIPLATICFLVLAAGFAVLLNRTAFGRHVCAVGANPRAARYAAIGVGKVQFMTYVLAGLSAGIAAFLFSSRLNAISSTDAGLSYELDAIAGAVIGGTAMNGGRGSIAGTVAGVFILGIISNALDMWGTSANLQGLVKGLIIIVAVLIQRQNND